MSETQHTPVPQKSLSAMGEKFLDRIHNMAGLCMFCGKKNCPDKRKGSVLPETLKLNRDELLAAVTDVITESPSHSQLVAALEAAETHLGAMALMLRRWADESRNGGWSTHQVDANLKAATMCDAGIGKISVALRAAREGRE